jgi:ankyrin repeat protein
MSLSHFADDFDDFDDATGLADAPLAPALTSWLAYHDFPGLHACGENGETPLMRAASIGDGAVATALLAHGCPLHELDDEGNNALWHACRGGCPAVAALLIAAGIDVDHANDDDVTCLMLAARDGDLNMCKLLLAHGANPGHCAASGRCALDMASGCARASILRLARKAQRA